MTLQPAQRRSGISDLAAIQQANPERYPFLLHSAAAGGEAGNGRYDILFAFPGERLRLQADGRLAGRATGRGDFLSALDDWWRAESVAGGEDGLPFRGGWFLYLGYELAGQIETRLRLPAPAAGQPVAEAVRIPAAIINDRLNNETWLLAETDAAMLEAMAADLAAGGAPLPGPPACAGLRADAPERYLRQAKRVGQYIREGDVFQVNLSRKWQAPLSAGENSAIDAGALYRRLCARNPAPFAGLAYLSGLSILSSSPERLVRVRGRRVETRPIAGTRPRDLRAPRDRALKSELIGHPKERAEHIMLIDLERNDLGRICEPGSIAVDELMAIESYAHVHHIVSNVSGRLREEVTPAAVIRAVFPGGTITGCPKERCMAIIAELEKEARGAYTGSMGYLNRDGDMDLNILIRTITRDATHLTLRAGAGLVADSDAERELQETAHKARGLLLALEAGAEETA